MPDADASHSLFWGPRQLKGEFFWWLSDAPLAIEIDNDALKSVLASDPFMRMGRVVILRSFAHLRR